MLASLYKEVDGTLLSPSVSVPCITYKYKVFSYTSQLHLYMGLCYNFFTDVNNYIP